MENEVMSIDDVLGDAIPYDQQDAMRQFCLFSLKMPTVGSITQICFPPHTEVIYFLFLTPVW